jgi:hypothetical protein
MAALRVLTRYAFLWHHCRQNTTHRILQLCGVLSNVRHKVRSLQRTYFVRSCGSSLRNRLMTDARYIRADTRKSRGNAIVRRLACSVAWKFIFSVFPRDASPFPQFVLLHSVTCVQLRLITILGNCGCVAVASFLGVPLPLLCK